MINRRLRLDIALSTLPYDPNLVQFSTTQQCVEDIIARLRTDDTSGEDESDDEKFSRLTRAALEADGFAEQAMCEIDMSEASKGSKLQKMFQGEDVERAQLLKNSIQAMNEARLKLLQQWERSKRKALDLLTVEIEKVQAMDQLEAQGTAQRFEMFCDGAEEHNTSTPKTSEGDDDDDDEDYEPGVDGGSGKRKRVQSPATSTPQTKRPCLDFEFEFDHDESSPLVTIGPNGTQVARDFLQQINWNLSGPAITRKLLCQVFDRDTLAFHTLSGKPSPAFKDCARPSKQQLDPHKVADLVHLMTTRLDMTARDVRTAITTKCADENKMLRARLQRNPRQQK